MTLYVALFVLMTLAALIVIPPETFEQQVGHRLSIGEMASLGWFVASIATVGGALGSLLESSDAVRAAAYRSSAVASRANSTHE